MSTSVTLRGITWDHSRGHTPLVATAQRFHELHPDIDVVWEKRSLKAFEDFPVERLAEKYDLIVLDHPCMGHVARCGALLPLDEHLAPAFVADQAANPVGASHASYSYAGHQWALATDAATPVAFWREDLLARHNATVPRAWEDLLALARRGLVEIPAAPINCLMNFYSLCIAAGEEPFVSRDRVASRGVALVALARLRELIALCDPGCWSRNPIASHNLVSSSANVSIAYCPLAYGYSNYARAGYADHRLTFGVPPSLGGVELRTTLGGAGLAISAKSSLRREALAYAGFTASASVQRTLYTHSGGQPGHRSAWLDTDNNRLTANYFTNTLSVLDRAWLRPRYEGYPHFQEAGSPIIHTGLRGEVAEEKALDQLDALYRETLKYSSS